MERLSDVSDGRLEELIASVRPDVVLTLGLNRILPAALLASPPPLWINAHLGLLPEHRGPAPVFWALYDRDDRFGVSVHVIEPEVDAGKVLAQRAIAIASRNLYAGVGALRALSVSVVFEALDNLRRGAFPPISMDTLTAIRKSPSRADVVEFTRRGNKLV